MTLEALILKGCGIIPDTCVMMCDKEFTGDVAIKTPKSRPWRTPRSNVDMP